MFLEHLGALKRAFTKYIAYSCSEGFRAGRGGGGGAGGGSAAGGDGGNGAAFGWCG